MRITIILGAIASAILAGCASSVRESAEAAVSGPPVPLNWVVMHDIQGLWGGEAIWVKEDRTAIIQVVESGQKEKRYRARVRDAAWTELERLIGAHDFLHLQISPRRVEPDEAHPLVALVTKDGTRARVGKLGNDSHPRFDALYGHLREMCRATEGARELIHEGEYDWSWCPDGYDKLW